MIIILRAVPLLLKKYRQCLLFAMGFVILLPGISWTQPRNLMVDGARFIGVIRSFQGVNCGPIPFMPGLADVSRQYRDLRIDK
jgi:hypothetical protein